MIIVRRVKRKLRVPIVSEPANVMHMNEGERYPFYVVLQIRLICITRIWMGLWLILYFSCFSFSFGWVILCVFFSVLSIQICLSIFCSQNTNADWCCLWCSADAELLWMWKRENFYGIEWMWIIFHFKNVIFVL